MGIDQLTYVNSCWQLGRRGILSLCVYLFICILRSLWSDLGCAGGIKSGELDNGSRGLKFESLRNPGTVFILFFKIFLPTVNGPPRLKK